MYSLTLPLSLPLSLYVHLLLFVPVSLRVLSSPAEHGRNNALHVSCVPVTVKCFVYGSLAPHNAAARSYPTTVSVIACRRMKWIFLAFLSRKMAVYRGSINDLTTLHSNRCVLWSVTNMRTHTRIIRILAG